LNTKDETGRSADLEPSIRKIAGVFRRHCLDYHRNGLCRSSGAWAGTDQEGRLAAAATAQSDTSGAGSLLHGGAAGGRSRTSAVVQVALRHLGR